MIENSDNKKPGLLRFRNLLILLLTLVLLVFVTDLISIRSQKKALITKYGAEGSTVKDNRGFYSVETIELLRRKSYLAGRIELAKSDSITLVVSLADSVLRLELKGVVIHRAPIVSYSKSRLFESVDPFAISNLLSQPGRVIKYDGTLPKEPIMLKIAPKDTAEANKPDIVPDTARMEPVYYTLTLDNSIKVSVSESVTGSGKSRMAGIIFRSGERVRETWRVLTSVLTGKESEHTMFINVKVDARDGRIIYRALPHTASVTVRL